METDSARTEAAIAKRAKLKPTVNGSTYVKPQLMEWKKTQFDKVVEVRQRAHDKFGVDSTPTFFINGKRLTGEKTFKDFEAALEGKAPSEGTPPPSG